MASLSSSSTLEEIYAAYDDNALFDVNGSADEAKSFLQSVRFLKRRFSTDIEQGDNSVANKLEGLAADEERVISWLSANDSTFASSTGGGRIRALSLENFRG